jgi:hypothetical protein
MGYGHFDPDRVDQMDYRKSGSGGIEGTHMGCNEFDRYGEPPVKPSQARGQEQSLLSVRIDPE